MSANERQVGGTHYSPGKNSYMHWDWAAENNLGYLEGQITKYISRWRQKEGVKDLEKALHYAEKLCEVRAEWSDLMFRVNSLDRTALRLSEMIQLYQLSLPEQEVFHLAVTYANREDLDRIRRLIASLIENGDAP